MLQSYLPALVFLLLGVLFGGLFAVANGLLGPRRPNPIKYEPYESGIPSNVPQNFRFGISFYLIAMLFILFDIEVVFLYPVAVQLKAFGTFALVETITFIVLLFIAFIYVWRRGALEWKQSANPRTPGTAATTSASASPARASCCAASSRARTWSATSRS